jgi:hypothetical protein
LISAGYPLHRRPPTSLFSDAALSRMREPQRFVGPLRAFRTTLTAEAKSKIITTRITTALT